MTALQRIDDNTFEVPGGGTVQFDSPETARRAMRLWSQGSSGGNLALGVKAGEAVLSGLAAARIRELVRDAREDRDEVRRDQRELLSAIEKNSSMGPDIAAKMRKVFRSQARLDASQTEAAAKMVAIEIGHAVGSGLEVLSALSNDSDGGLVGGTMGAVVGGGAIVVGLSMLFDDDEDDDEDDRRRRRRRL